MFLDDLQKDALREIINIAFGRAAAVYELLTDHEEWRADWESRDVERYLRHYSKRFQSGNVNFAGFAQQKRQVAGSKSWIKVRLDQMSFFRNPGKEEMVVVTFEQDYRSNNLNNNRQHRRRPIPAPPRLAPESRRQRPRGKRSARRQKPLRLFLTASASGRACCR